MDHVPELWKELRLEFKDNLWKKNEEIYYSLTEEDEPINNLSTIRNRKLNLADPGLRKIVKKPEKVENKSEQIQEKAPEMGNKSGGIMKKPEKMVNKSEGIMNISIKNPKNPLKKLHCIIC